MSTRRATAAVKRQLPHAPVRRAPRTAGRVARAQPWSARGMACTPGPPRAGDGRVWCASARLSPDEAIDAGGQAQHPNPPCSSLERRTRAYTGSTNRHTRSAFLTHPLRTRLGLPVRGLEKGLERPPLPAPTGPPHPQPKGMGNQATHPQVLIYTPGPTNPQAHAAFMPPPPVCAQSGDHF